MEPLRLFGIPISRIGYYVNWVLTNAQIELIAADVSVVDYNFDKKKGRKKTAFDNTKADPSKVRKAAKEWKEKYGDDKNAGAGLSMSDIFSNKEMKADVGINIK